MLPGGCACMRRPRSVTMPTASSRRITPETVAATYSPTLWPSNAAGSAPQDCHNLASAYSTANRTGWVADVCASRVPATGPSRLISLSRSGPSFSRTRAAHSPKAAANSGSAASTPLAIPTC